MDKFKLEVYDRLYNKDILDKKPFYNIGAGRNFYHPYWINVDYDSEWYKNEISKNIINHNLMSIEPIPIEKDSVEIIYTSHTIEHISEKAVFKLFKDSLPKYIVVGFLYIKSKFILSISFSFILYYVIKLQLCRSLLN